MSDPEDVMFSAGVKAEQTRLGSRAGFEGRTWNTEITDDLRRFLAVIDTFFFANSGAEITEAAAKLATQATKRPHTVAFSGSFHGRTHMAMAMTTRWRMPPEN